MSKTKKINYLIGRYLEDEPELIFAYPYGDTVHFGTIEEAKDFKNFVEKMESSMRENKNKNPYKIFKLIELE